MGCIRGVVGGSDPSPWEEAPGARSGVGRSESHRRVLLQQAGPVRGSWEPAGDAGPSADTRVRVVFDGALTNADQLWDGLERRGAPAARRDARALSRALYGQYGPAFVHLLRGSFAVAVWDEPRERLCLARDHLGTRPLYYTRSGDPLAFSTDLGALLALPGVSREPDLLGALDYLALGGTTPPRTMCHDVRKLAAGQLLLWHDGRVSLQRYWTPVLSEVDRSVSWEAIAEEWDERVGAILRRLPAATVVCLDDGPGSSLLATQLTHVSRNATTDLVAVDDPRGRASLASARRLAEHLGCRHADVLVSSEEVGQDLVEMIRRAVLPGDERTALEYRRFRQPRWAGATTVRGDGGAAILGARDWLGHSLPGTPGESRRGGAGWPERVFPHRELAKLWAGEPATSMWHEALESELARAAAGGGEDAASRAIAVELDLMLPETRLAPVDGLAGLEGVECRYPFLEQGLVDAMNAQGPRPKTDGWAGRDLWSRLVRKSVPSWIRTPADAASAIFPPREIPAFARVALEREQVRRAGYFDPSAVAELLEGHRQGSVDAATRLWRILGVQLWHEHVSMGGGGR